MTDDMPRISSETDDFTNTGNVSGNFVCTWKLENFSKLDYTCGRSHRCQGTHTGEGKYDIWHLKIFPGGDEAKNVGYVSLSLCSNVTYRRRMKMQYVVQLRNTDEKIIKTLEAESENFYIDWAHERLVERIVLLRELTDDVLVIQVKATFNDMGPFQAEKIPTDVVISVGEDIPVHSAVLAARSKVFAAMFEHDTTEKSSYRVFINDFDMNSVRALIQFMYYGSIGGMTVDLAKDMLRAADKYEINDLKIYCNNYLISQLDCDDIDDSAVGTDTNNASNLREKFIRFSSLVTGKVKSKLRNSLRRLRS